MNEDKKILVVEDELPLLKILKKQLELEGFKVITAEDGKVGLELASKESPDLILLDIVMPNMDGMEMLRILRNDPKTDQILVILLTNIADTTEILAAKELRSTDYLIKSNSRMEDIISLVKEKMMLV